MGKFKFCFVSVRGLAGCLRMRSREWRGGRSKVPFVVPLIVTHRGVLRHSHGCGAPSCPCHHYLLVSGVFPFLPEIPRTDATGAGLAFVCSRCDYRCGSYPELRYHRALHHANDVRDEEILRSMRPCVVSSSRTRCLRAPLLLPMSVHRSRRQGGCRF